MRLLLHICCGPCALMPLRLLLDEGHEVTGYFDNPNIHPLTEYMRRREGAMQVAQAAGVTLLFAPQPEYDAESWCRSALGHPGGRCAYCWSGRLDRTAKTAADLGFDGFSSSLLYSRRQKHEGIMQAGEAAAAEHGVRFVYQDFRPFWQQGIDASKELGVYRQQYCGCIFSEEDRYKKQLAEAIALSAAHAGPLGNTES